MMNGDAQYQPQLEQAVLTDGDMRVCLLSYGAITQGWWHKGTPLILGYDDPQAYVSDTNYMGAIVGRVANRISGAQFDLGNKTFELTANEHGNTLHGGAVGLSHRNWALEHVSQTEADLSLISQDGEDGFPGTVRFEVNVKLDCPRLVYTIQAFPDRPTPISIAQHNYYSLGSAEGISAHRLRLASQRILETDATGCATGATTEACAGHLDFTKAKTVQSAPEDLDHYYCIDPGRPLDAPIADFTSPSGLRLSVMSDQPGAQIYSGAKMAHPFFSRAGLCIEPSGYPNAVNIATFPSILCSPEKPYRQVLALEVSEGLA